MRDLLERAADFAFAELDKVEGEPRTLPVPLQTFVVIYTVQAIIDNGGLEYLLENEFPNTPPYELFINAYQAIGARAVADAIEQALAVVETAQADLSYESRINFLHDLRKGGSPAFVELSSQVCAVNTIWTQLEQYVTVNMAAFSLH